MQQKCLRLRRVSAEKTVGGKIMVNTQCPNQQQQPANEICDFEILTSNVEGPQCEVR